MDPYFFGYGSLVNRDTHIYTNAHRAQLNGWARMWVGTADRENAFLTVVRNTDTQLDGLIAAVPDADWAALDLRETGYARIPSQDAVIHDLRSDTDIAHYAVPPETTKATDDHVILLSYLDVVVQGYLREFGASGVSRFFATTTGWNTKILDDRAAPQYPRAQVLSQQETALVDQHLALLSARIT